MAACNDPPLAFYQTLNSSFYFQALECHSHCEFETDGFRKTERKPKHCWIQSLDQKFLVFKTPGKLEFEDRTVFEQKEADSTFYIQLYNDSSPEGQQPVMLYVLIDGRKMTVTCQNNREVCAEEVDPNGLKLINGSGHKALFRRAKITRGKYEFESTLYPGHFLALEEADGSCLHKLILRPRSSDEVDERGMVYVTPCSS